MKDEKVPPFLQELADAAGGTIDFVSGPLSDGTGFATMSFALPKDHWIYAEGPNVPPMPFRMGEKDISLLTTFTTERKTAPAPARMSRHEFADKVRDVGKYAVRCATMNGSDMDFDPDAMLQNLVVGMIGYWTQTGLSSDDWENPPQQTGPAPDTEGVPKDDDKVIPGGYEEPDEEEK